MEGFLWLLLQTLPLLTAAAVVFFLLGWRWRGQDSRRETKTQSLKIDAENIEAETARQERDTARALEENLRLALTLTQAELQEAQDRQTQLQKEILRLSDELKESKQAQESLRQDLLNQQQALVVEREELSGLRQKLETAREAPAPVTKKPRAGKAKEPAAAKPPAKPKKTRPAKPENPAE